MSVERAAELMARARAGVALTGAGISAESGIPTFRGAGGLWAQYDPVKVASIDNFLRDPSAYWKVAKERGPAVLAARPNPGHHALAALERAGRLIAVVTQNTDGLHQDAGSRRVIELHGFLFGEAMPIPAVEEAFALARAADVMLVVGSSLVVYPAAHIPSAAVDHGATLIVVNAEPTPLDRIAEVVIRGRAGEVLPELATLTSAA